MRLRPCVAALAALAVFAVACRKDGRADRADAEPAVEPSAGAVLAACGSPELDLAIAVTDPRCAIGSGEAKRLRAGLEKEGAATALRQEAKLGSDGRVILRLVNDGPKALTLPLSYHPKLPAFSALAEDERHAVFELDSPKLEGGSQVSGARFAKIVLSPGAAAVARITVPTTVVKRIAPPCAQEERTCAPPRLAAGKYALHVGELLVDVEAGAPARLEWSLP